MQLTELSKASQKIENTRVTVKLHKNHRQVVPVRRKFHEHKLYLSTYYRFQAVYVMLELRYTLFFVVPLYSIGIKAGRPVSFMCTHVNSTAAICAAIPR